MQGSLRNRTASFVLLAIVALGGALVQTITHPLATRAQTQQYTGTVVNICGTVSAYTAATASAPGSITFTENSVNTTFGIAAGLSFAATTSVANGQDLCLTGVLNSANQLLSASIKTNVPQSTTLCGVAGQYIPPSPPSPGVFAVAGTSFPVAFGTEFSGPVGAGTNICIALTVNGLGQITGGTAQNNSGTTTSSVPVEFCGTVTGYTAPTPTAAGSIAFTAGGVSRTYTLPAGATVTGTGSIANGQSLCFIGIVGPSNVITTTFMVATNFTTNVVVCGPLNGYTAASTTSLGYISLGSTTLPIAYGTVPTGDFLIQGQGTCITSALNGLGQASTLIVQDVTLPTSTPTPTATAAGIPTATNTPVPIPPPPTFNTATPTATPLPPATNTPTPTSTPIPPPPPKASFTSVTVKYKTVRAGTRESLTAHAGFAGKQRIVVAIYYANGLKTAFHAHTNSKGVWSKAFTVPRDTIGRYSGTAVVTFQVFKNHTSARDFLTFTVVR